MERSQHNIVVRAASFLNGYISRRQLCSKPRGQLMYALASPTRQEWSGNQNESRNVAVAFDIEALYSNASKKFAHNTCITCPPAQS